MTISIFPDVAGALDQLPASDTTGPPGRWVLHRAGILNVWQYDRVELRFAGGRLLLRGKNGAGKSKALEIILPFLFDGDTRRLDATGRDRTSVRWLMSDGRPAGNHVGYVWLELRCADGDADGERFHTLGAGLKASTATGRTDAWFFSTERRVGIDLLLDRAGECLSIDKLKEAIGEEAVTPSGSEHRRRVGRHLFGLFDESRFDNLLHLMHRLRDPNIGNRVEAGELAHVLSDALPPIDERVLSDAAGRFDDLESIREQVERADRTAAALNQFLGVYRGYARTVLSRRSAAVDAAERQRAGAERDRNRAERAVATAAEAVERRTAELDELKRERLACDDDRRAMESSEAYRAHLDLADRDARVTALDQSAHSAETTAARSATAHEQAIAEAERCESEVADESGALLTSAAAADSLLDASGLDRGLLGSPAMVPGVGPDVTTVVAAERRAQATVVAAEIRHQRAGDLHELAVTAQRASEKADAAEERAAESEGVVEAERRTLHDRRSACHAAEAEWAATMREWTRSGVAADSGADWSDVHACLDHGRDDVRWPETIRSSVTDALAAPLRSARSAAAAAAASVASGKAAVAEAEARVADLAARTEARPEPNRFRSAQRDAAAGAPFYELVDVRDTLGADEAAGLEAALEASGILDAWVSADGVAVHPRTNDVIVAAEVAADDGAPSLAGVLRPAIPANSPVHAGTVVALLSAIGWGEQAQRSTWVANDGRWRTGLLHGAWSKTAVEFLGAGARRETRRRQLERARTELAARREGLASAQAAAAGAETQRDLIEALPTTMPSHALIDDNRREVLTAERALVLAASRHDTDRRASEQARTAANRLAVAVADRAAAGGLPVTIDQLDVVIDALRQLMAVLGEHRRGLAALGRAVERLTERRARVAERAAEASTDQREAADRRRQHASAAAELAALREALGTTVQDVLDRHGAVVGRIGELDVTLIPVADAELRAAGEERAAAAVRLEGVRHAEVAAITDLGEAIARLDTAVSLPGVALAATRAEIDGAVSGVALARAVGPLVDGDDEVGDTMVLARYDRLSDALTGGYDTAIEEIDGIKVVHVDDDGGRRPLAVVAAVLDEQARTARGRLVARERDVLERFLLGELGDEVRSKLLDAHDLVTDTNRMLHGVRTSHGKGARLDWTLRDDVPDAARTATRLLVDELRDDDGNAALRDALLTLIDAERSNDPTASYEQHLRSALDYRTWHRFAVKVTDSANLGSPRTLSSRLGLSQGEQRVLSYLALFAAAAAHFEAIARDAPQAPRVLLLDDAFAKVDEPTHGQLLGLLVDLGLDFVLTSERMWGCFPTVPSLEIYEAIRDPSTPGVALMHFRWDGHRRTLVPV